MDLVAGDSLARGDVAAGHGDRRLVAAEHRLDVEQSETRDRARPSLDPVRIADRAAEDLKPAADAEDAAAAATVGENVDVPALPAKKNEIGDGRLRTGDEHEVRIRRDRLARLDDDQRDARLQPQRVEIIEVGDAGKRRHRDDERRARLPVAGEAEHVLGRQRPRLLEPGHDAE